MPHVTAVLVTSRQRKRDGTGDGWYYTRQPNTNGATTQSIQPVTRVRLHAACTTFALCSTFFFQLSNVSSDFRIPWPRFLIAYCNIDSVQVLHPL